jgi:quinohemoprotein ethanol dehydrogenase
MNPLNTLGVVLILIAGSHAQAADTDWSSYGLNHTEQRFSPLTQINRDNVAGLGLDWALDLPNAVSVNSTPLAVDGVIYFSADRAIVHAVDSSNGKLIWSYDPQSWKHAPRGIAIGFNTNRGITYWQGRIFVGTGDGRLVALNATDGQVLWASRAFPVGERKAINGAPRAFDGKVFIGNSGAEFGTRGYVEAYDAISGERLWRFYTVPDNPADGFENAAMEMAAKTWHGEWWRVFGGGTVWNALTYDPELELLYVGVGNGDPWDHDLRSQGKGDNLFLCSIVALDANTGEYVWHYQTNPGEQWDYKATADMILAEIEHDGQTRKVLMQAPSNGFFYVLDRATGELLSAEPFEKVTWAEGIDLTTGRPLEVPGIRMKPGEQQLIYPSPFGAHNWQAMSYNPLAGLAYIPTIRMGAIYSKNTEFEFRDNFFVIAMVTEYPLTEPDDGTGGLVAWDPVRQEARWRVQYATPWHGGTLTTAGNLVFHGTGHGAFYAYDAHSGESLWEFNAGRGITGAPMTYLRAGKQHVVLPVGWGGQASFGLPAFQKHGWKYKGPGIRLLSFSLEGDAMLPDVADDRFSLNPPDTGEVPLDDALVQLGFGIYHQSSCAVCHGGNVISNGAAGPDLRESPLMTDYRAFRAVVVEGSMLPLSMPMFDDLTEREVRGLFEYIRQQIRVAD